MATEDVEFGGKKWFGRIKFLPSKVRNIFYKLASMWLALCDRIQIFKLNIKHRNVKRDYFSFI